MNIGSTDRTFRLIAGVILILLSFTLLGGIGTASGIALSIVGVVLLVTGVINFCPAYKILGISTRHSQQ